jgi:surface antigen
MEACNTNTSMKNASSKMVQMKAISTETQSQNNLGDLQGVIQRKENVITIEQFLLAGGRTR